MHRAWWRSDVDYAGRGSSTGAVSTGRYNNSRACKATRRDAACGRSQSSVGKHREPCVPLPEHAMGRNDQKGSYLTEEAAKAAGNHADHGKACFGG